MSGRNLASDAQRSSIGFAAAIYAASAARLLRAASWAALAALLPLLLPEPVAAVENGETGPIRFHRVLAPEGRIKDWPLGDAKYLPVDADEFERRIAAAKATGPAAPAAVIASARYEAKLHDAHLIGRAVVDVRLSGPLPAALSWEPCNLAMTTPQWDAETESSPPPKPQATAEYRLARVSLGTDADGRMQMRVDRSGRFQFDWSLAGRRDSAGVLGFAFELPSAAAGQLQIELPNELTPSINRGLLIGSEPSDASHRLWRIALGPGRRCRIRVLPANVASQRSQLALLRASHTYEFSTRGIDVAAQWRLQVHNQPLQQIRVQLDPGLRLVSARLGEVPVSWSVSPASEGEGTRAVLTLPEPILDGERVVRLGAIGPLTSDRPWRLPRIRAEGLFWQEGTVALLIPTPLVAERVVPLGCAQTGVAPLSPPRLGESLQFQAFEPEATVELRLARRASDALSNSTATPATLPNDAVTPPSPATPHRTTETVASSSTPESAKDLDAVPRAPDDLGTVAGKTWAWNCHLESWFHVDGTALHQVAYSLHVGGGRPLRVALPAGAALGAIRGVWIDGEPAAWQSIASATGDGVVVNLPADRPALRAVIQWTASGPRMGTAGKWTPPLPDADVAVLAKQWTAWLPPGYERFDAQRTWSRRLFGPLGRGADADRFDPLLADDWKTLWSALRPGKTNLAATAENGDTPGWTAWRIDLSGGAAAPLRYVYRPTIGLLGMVVFLLTASWGCCSARVRPAWWLLLLGLFAAAAMLLPGALTPPAWGGVLGILFHLARQWFWRGVDANAAGAPGDRPANAAPSATINRPVQIGLILAGWLLAAGVAWADDSPAAHSESAESPIYRVLIPIDAEKNPAGGKVYVPEPLYQTLFRRSASAKSPQQWLIRRAAYRGVLAADAASGRPAIDLLRAQYDVQTFARGVQVRVPLGGEGATVLEDSCLLEGRAVKPEWSPDAAAMIFPIAEPGEYRLEIFLRPTIRSIGGPSGIDLAIPCVPNARLSLQLPDEAPAVEVPSACGEVVLEKNPPRLAAELGPTDRLTVCWHERMPSGAIGPSIEAEQLFWLKARPGSVVIAAKFTLNVPEGEIQQMRLALDPRLRLLPFSGDDPPAVQLGPESGQSRLLALQFSQPVSGRIVVEATFLLSGATGVGKFRLPRIELLDARTTRRWMAVSVDPSLEREEQRKQPLEVVAVADFLKAWGPADARPHAVYHLPTEEIDWTIATRPQEHQTAADQTLSLGCRADRVDVVFEADVATASGYLFQHRLTAPPDLKIESAAVLEAGVERASRWSRDADGSATIFLNSAVSGEQKITLRGQLPIEAGKPWPLPLVRLEGCGLRTATIRLFRDPSTKVVIRGGPPQSIAETAPADADMPKLGRLEAAFVWDGSQMPPVTVTVEPTRPKSAGREKAAVPPLAGSKPAPEPPMDLHSFEAEAPRPTLDGPPVQRDRFLPRFLFAAGLVALGILAAAAASRPALVAPILAHPHAVGVIFGLAWWLWLVPSVLGLVIALACTLAAGRQRMQAMKKASARC